MNKETRQFIWNLLKFGMDIFFLVVFTNRLNVTTSSYGETIYIIAIIITGLSIGHSFYKIEKSLK